MRAKLEASDAWVDGRATAGYQGASVKRNQQIAEGSPIALEFGDILVGTLERHPLFISAVLPNRMYPPLFNRYEGGMHFGNHVDGASRIVPGHGAARAHGCIRHAVSLAPGRLRWRRTGHRKIRMACMK